MKAAGALAQGAGAVTRFSGVVFGRQGGNVVDARKARRFVMFFPVMRKFGREVTA